MHGTASAERILVFMFGLSTMFCPFLGFWLCLRSIDTVVAWSVYLLGCGVHVFVSSSFGYSSTARGRINRTQLMD